MTSLIDRSAVGVRIEVSLAAEGMLIELAKDFIQTFYSLGAISVCQSSSSDLLDLELRVTFPTDADRLDEMEALLNKLLNYKGFHAKSSRMAWNGLIPRSIHF